MADYAIGPWPHPSLPVHGTEPRFPVRRIFCVGRNYAEHVREMGGDPERSAPFFFMKPPDALVESGGHVPYPPLTADLHHEVELVIAMAGGGGNIAADQALETVYGYAVGIDLTRRDLQGEAKAAGRPWEAGKAFHKSAPSGAVYPVAEAGHPERGAIWLKVNGETRQQGDLGQMIWAIPEVIAELSKLFTVLPGDLIFTGTPAGVGPVQPGDVLHAGIDGLGELTVTIDPPNS